MATFVLAGLLVACGTDGQLFHTPGTTGRLFHKVNRQPRYMMATPTDKLRLTMHLWNLPDMVPKWKIRCIDSRKYAAYTVT